MMVMMMMVVVVVGVVEGAYQGVLSPRWVGGRRKWGGGRYDGFIYDHGYLLAMILFNICICVCCICNSPVLATALGGTKSFQPGMTTSSSPSS